MQRKETNSGWHISHCLSMWEKQVSRKDRWGEECFKFCVIKNVHAGCDLASHKHPQWCSYSSLQFSRPLFPSWAAQLLSHKTHPQDACRYPYSQKEGYNGLHLSQKPVMSLGLTLFSSRTGAKSE